MGVRAGGEVGYVVRETDRRMTHTEMRMGGGLGGRHVPGALASLHRHVWTWVEEKDDRDGSHLLHDNSLARSCSMNGGLWSSTMKACGAANDGSLLGNGHHGGNLTTCHRVRRSWAILSEYDCWMRWAAVHCICLRMTRTIHGALLIVMSMSRVCPCSCLLFFLLGLWMCASSKCNEAYIFLVAKAEAK